MLHQIARRLGIFAVSLLGASLLIFIVTQALPGDVARVIAGDGASEVEIAALRHQLGLDRPFGVRYLEWLGGMATGDFGRSYLSDQTVSSVITPTLGITAWLVTFALALSVLIAIPAGMVAALYRRRPAGVAASALTQLGMAVPAFWAGVMLTYVFAVWLGWLPPNGYVSVRTDVGAWASHLVLPVLSLALVQAAVLTRYVRGAFVEVLHEDYYRTARAIGWTRGRAMIRHGLRNASLSLVTVLGLQLAAVLVGAIVIEQVFVLPGLGSKLLYAVSQSDTMVIQGIVMLLVLAVLTINFVVDISYVILDPRLRGGNSR